MVLSAAGPRIPNLHIQAYMGLEAFAKRL